MSTHENRPSGTEGTTDEGMFYANTPVGRAGSAYSASGRDPADPFDDAGFSDSDYGDSDATTTMAAPDESEPGYLGDAFEAERRAVHWHGGADFGLLVLRLVVGGGLIVHGSQHLFGLFNGVGHDEFSRYLFHQGYQHTGALAWVAGGTELGGGALLVLGLATPLAAAGLLGVLSQVITLKLTAGAGFFTPTGYQAELELALAAGAFALLFTGPGRVALDRPTPWFRHPVLNAWIFLTVGAAASVAVWFTMR